MSSRYDSQDSFAFELYDQSEWTQSEDAAVTRENTVGTDPFSQQQTQLQPVKLGFCQPDEWDKEKVYDEDPPSFIHYSIEWKVTVNNRKVCQDTEQGMVLAPALCWRLLLQPKLEKFLDRKLAKNRPVKSEDTNFIISVNERGQDDLIKRFDDTNVNWSVIERQLVVWSELFRRGKKLTVKISFNYVESSQGSAISSRKADKRGSSITDRMLTERDTQLDIEEASSGRPSIWSNVYELMRCQVLSCNSGPHCWRDPVGKKHYKLRTSQLRILIERVKEGYTLETHDDVPEEIRQQLYAEDNQKRRKLASTSAANCPPINITNVLPTAASQIAPASDMSSVTPITRLDIPRPRDAAVKDYCAWQQSQVENPEQKAAYQKACKVIMDDCMDLELIYLDPNPEFLIEKGVKRGAALHIVRDIERWVKRPKRAEAEE